MQQISAPQLKTWLDDAERTKPVLVDVRQPWEFDVCRIDGSKPLPMSAIPARFMELDRNAETVVICHHGARSYQVCMFLEHQGFTNIFNLYGGVAAWAQQVDPAMPTY
ncbi:rhodanese-like domain-containing protein [Sulfurisoma sediminicola]|uniref:Rhodanese-related sulfurtransferase n=1 Tax=Sulfurisoma sediminicola TaxID=1381557 RepID=A0A497XNR1_9PROT|nr:rhodanese-like domain-containing protein [Sulfurisoma sediminicola]RLJ68018.1 rhodanese-related sulfurtransferase [Sulfurisoma sediminicola]